MTIVRAISRIVFYFRRYRYGGVSLRMAACAVLTAVLASPPPADATIVRMETNGLGGFNIELYDADARQTVDNFLKYMGRTASNGGYDSTIIHRTVPDFVIQGGGYGCCYFDGNPVHIATLLPVPNEFSPSRSNVRGTIAMAKLAGDPNSATSEWFINLADNGGTSPSGLDFQNGGFTVFGRVLNPGMDVVDKIAAQRPLSNRNAYNETITSLLTLVGVPMLGNDFVFVVRVCINNDGDGACPETEDKALNGDGNGDGIPDRDQANVTTILTQFGLTATFATDTAMKFDSVNTLDTATAVSRLNTFKSPSDISVTFNNGIFSFLMTGTMGGVGHVVTLYDGATVRPTRYYAYGPTTDNPTPHWYDFTFDGVTGAAFASDRITLHFVDGKRGDDDLTVNDSITHTGAQAVVTENANSSSQAGGGCSIVATPSQTSRGGDWIVVSLFLALLALIRKRTRNSRIRRTPRQRSFDQIR